MSIITDLAMHKKHVAAGLGVANASDLTKALTSAGLNFEVMLQPDINEYTQEKTGFYNTFRIDNKRKLGAGLRDRYAIVQTSDVFSIAGSFVERLGAPGTVHNPRVWDGGASVSFDMDVGAFLVGKPQVGDVVMHRFTFKNSFDGSGVVLLSCVTYRLRCGNGACSLEGVGSFSIRHTKSADAKIEQAAHLFAGASKAMATTEKVFNLLAETPVDRKSFENILEKLWPSVGTKQAQKNALGIKEQIAHNYQAADGGFIDRDTGWNALNAITHYTNHSAPVRDHGGGSEAARAAALIGGSIFQKNQQAIKVITRELKLDSDIDRIMRDVEESQAASIASMMDAKPVAAQGSLIDWMLN